ncbi:MAG: CHASE2 domain-containing protein [Candidatus Omnitrophica bacterium]|nr:CHASE2 domain-containing protein [Candidatus Omnitrophota bacterium]
MKPTTVIKLVAGCLIALSVGILFLIKSFEKSELTLYDWRIHRSYAPQAIPVPVAIVGLTEHFESDVGEPFSRKFYTQLLEIMEKEEASVVGFDIFFPQVTDSAVDAEFIKAIKKNGKVILPVFSPTRLTERKGAFYPAPSVRGSSEEFNNAAFSLGHINTLSGEDQVVRKIPVFIKAKDTDYPQISLEMARIYQNRKEISVPFRIDSPLVSFIPVRADGSIYIKLLPPDELAKKHFISFEDVILGRFPDGFFKNKAVIVGQTIVGAKNADLVPTPWGTQFGVLLQAGILHNVLSGQYVHRIDDKAVLIALLLLGSVLGIIVFSSGAAGNTLLLGGFSALSVLFSFYAMKHACLFIDIVPFFFLFLFLYFASLVYSLAKAVKQLFRRESAIKIMRDVEREITGILNPAEIPGITGDFSSSVWGGSVLIEQTPEITMRTLLVSLGIETGAFLLVQIPGKLQIIAQHGEPLFKKIDMDKLTRRVMAANRPVMLNRNQLKNEWGAGALRNLILLPVIVQPTYRISGLFINKYPAPFSKSSHFSRDDIPLIHTLSMQALIAIQNARLNLALKDTQMESIFRLSVAIEYRDRETGMHIHRVSEYSGLIAQNIGLKKSEAELIKSAMPLHDIGKIAIPDHILLKPGKLTPEERKIVEQHPIIGAKMLEGSDSLLLQVSGTIALYHHEKYDGSGYPFHLKGVGIPLYGRIAAIADIFDAISSKRVYKKAESIQTGFAFVREASGTIFDPLMTEAFIRQEEEIKKIRDKYKDV